MRTLLQQLISRCRDVIDPQPHRRDLFETLEPRVLLSSVVGEGGDRLLQFEDSDGDSVLVRLIGPGSATITLEDDAATGANIDSIDLSGTTERSRLLVAVRPKRGGPGGPSDRATTVGSITGDAGSSLGAAIMRGVSLVTDGLNLTGSLGVLLVDSIENGANVTTGQPARNTVIRTNGIQGAPDGVAELNITGDIRLVDVRNSVDFANINATGNVGVVRVLARDGAGFTNSGGFIEGDFRALDVRGPIEEAFFGVAGDFSLIRAGLRPNQDAIDGFNVDVGGSMRQLLVRGDASEFRVAAGGDIFVTQILGDLTDNALLASAGNMRVVNIRGDINDAEILAGASLNTNSTLADATFAPGDITVVQIRGDAIDSIISAGGDPGEDGRFADGEILDEGSIRVVQIRGRLAGLGGEHDNYGIYAPQLGIARVGNLVVRKGQPVPGGTQYIVGNAVIDPLPTAQNALDTADIQDIIERTVARARQLGVNANIAISDREGNPLAVVRMTDAEAPAAPTTVDINAGGRGGLEAVDGIVATSLIALTKAGTAAFLSTSQGNAFTTRTAGFIIQKHFPPGVLQQDSGPLFGVQLSSLPTSDVNQLPLGLSADPGGVPLYRGGELIGGIGIEVDGVYAVDPTAVGGNVTIEEAIALAGQSSLAPPRNIRADRVFVDGLRLDYANAQPPSIAALGALPDYATLVGAADIDELFAPAPSPASRFEPAAIEINNGNALVIGEVPNNSDLDFYNDGTNTIEFDAGASNGGEALTVDDVDTVISQAHQLNSKLRAQIRRDGSQISQVTVAVVDFDGNVLGVFRTGDAPVFGYDVAVQKARTAAFFSRDDAGQQLRDLDTEVAADIALGQTIVGTDGQAIFSVDDPFGRHVDAAQSLGVDLDGSVAVADRTGGFLSRPNLPDGINSARSGPFTARVPDRFSPFNTGLQTSLIIPRLVDFLLAFNGMGEAAGLAAFAAGTLGGEASVPNDDVATGLPHSSLANGMQIFAGSVPLYKNGRLVGAVGVSGDGIEQDDFIAFTGATGYQEFGPNVARADQVVLNNGIRLPYVKLPRSPFAGV